LSDQNRTISFGLIVHDIIFTFNSGREACCFQIKKPELLATIVFYLQDPNRLYYEPWELRMFENIECEWPLFFCYLILDACFSGQKEAAANYTERLEEVNIELVSLDDGLS